MKTKEEVIGMSKVEFLEWVEEFKPLMPAYISLALKTGISRNTIQNVMSGISANETARGAIYEAICQRLSSIKSASII